MRDRRSTASCVDFHTLFRLGTRFQGAAGRISIFTAARGQKIGPPYRGPKLPPRSGVGRPAGAASLLLDLSLAQYGGAHEPRTQTFGKKTPRPQETLLAPTKMAATEKGTIRHLSTKECHSWVELVFVAGFMLRSPVWFCQ